MSATAINTMPRPLSGAGHIQEGPIVLAIKPFDGSEAPMAVARWLAQREERELHVVSVLERQDTLALAAGIPPLPQQYYDEERLAIAERMKLHLNVSRADSASRVDVLEGPSAQMIVDVAHDRGARMIVIGTGRHDPLGRYVYGERAMQIVRRADRPVLVVPRAASSGFIRRAVVAVDFSIASLRAAMAALPMLSRGSVLTLIYVKPRDANHEHSPPEVPEGRCAERFDRFMQLLPLVPGLEVNTRVLWGDPVIAIDEFARTRGVSLIACGRRQSHTIAERLFVGSVSSGLLRRVQCPILIVPEEQDVGTESISKALTGVTSWPRDKWPEQIEAFRLRNMTRRVRLGAESEALPGGRCVAQGYALRAVTYHQGENQLSISMADTAPVPNMLSIQLPDITELTLFTDIDGHDVRLTFENVNGRGTLTVAPLERP